MRFPVSSNIRSACNAVNTGRKRDDEPNGVGSLAAEVAEVARLCRIPDTEMHYETVGQSSGIYRRGSSALPLDVFGDYGQYMKARNHRHWYHIGQNYQQAAAAVTSGCTQPGMLPKPLLLQLQDKLQQRNQHLRGSLEGSAQSGVSSTPLTPMSGVGSGVLLPLDLSSPRGTSSSDGCSLQSMPSGASSQSHHMQLQYETWSGAPMSGGPGYASLPSFSSLR